MLATGEFKQGVWEGVHNATSCKFKIFKSWWGWEKWKSKTFLVLAVETTKVLFISVWKDTTTINSHNH